MQTIRVKIGDVLQFGDEPRPFSIDFPPRRALEAKRAETDSAWNAKQNIKLLGA